MTLFTATQGVPFSIAVQTMDTLLNEHMSIMFRVSIAILKIKEKELLSLNGIEKILPSIKEGVRRTIYQDSDEFFKVVFSISFSKGEAEVQVLQLSKFSNCLLLIENYCHLTDRVTTNLTITSYFYVYIINF